MKAMDLPETVARLFREYSLLIAAVAVTAMLAGIGTDRLIGGTVAAIAGTVQAFTVIVYICWGAIYYLFRPYEPKTTVLMEQPLVLLLRLLLFSLLSALALFSALFFGLRIAGIAS